MEIIAELIYEVFILGAIEIIKDKELPGGVRIGAGAVLFIVFGGILVLILHCAWNSWSEGSVVETILLSVLALTLIVLIISVFIKPSKNMKE